MKNMFLYLLLCVAGILVPPIREMEYRHLRGNGSPFDFLPDGLR